MAKKPTDLVVVDEGRAIRKWWQKNVTEGTGEVSLAKAFSDVGKVALWHIARRLTDPKTPETVKDKMAVALAPKMAVDLKGRLGKDGERSDEAGVGGILDSYRITQH